VFNAYFLACHVWLSLLCFVDFVSNELVILLG
jgi:hypothetical protein